MNLFGGVLSVTGITFLMLIVFVVAALGYLLGRITIKGVSLGTAGVFIVALLVGALLFTNDAESGAIVSNIAGTTTSLSKNYLKIIENLGLILFVTSVGFIAGPNFFSSLKKNFKSYALLSLIIIILGGLTALFCIKVLGCGTAMAVGILSGALTSTPAFSAAKDTLSTVYSASSADVISYASANDITAEEASKNIISSFEDVVTVGHGIAYLFGVVGVVLFVQLIPKILKADMDEERKKISSVDTGAKTDSGKKRFDVDGFGLASFAIAVVIGMLVGGIKIPMGSSTFTLGTTGGCLLSSLVVAHFGHFGALNMRPDKRVLEIFREFGLMAFLIGAGIPGGASFIAYFEPRYFLFGVLMTLVPMIIGFIIAKYVIKLPLFNTLGGITGGMTSTPALGTLINVAKTDDVATAYAAAYPIALIAVVLVSQFLITLFPDGLSVIGL
ncbi:MAG: permease [Oscillospiraceae bacterium]|nr:permease [Oscillospiraceae bacterium]